MKARTRDFIYTKDDLFFATTNYIHPENRILAFLRYIPDENGDREKDGKTYSKVSSQEAYEYLKEKHPEYIYFCDITNVEMMGVPLNKIERIIKPEERLKEIINEKTIENKLYKDLKDLSDFFHYIGKIPYENLGISGSILPGLSKEGISDLDFVIYGLNNHRKAIETFKKYKDQEVTIPEINKKITLNSIQDSYWERIYNKRIKDLSLSKEEFCFYENRKNNRGIINGILFDILSTRNWDEIHGKWGDIKYENIGKAKIEAKIKNAVAAFDNPATYEIEDLKLIEMDLKEKNGFKETDDKIEINELASFTHTYAGQAIEGEEIIAKGKIEKVIEKQKNGEIKNSYRLVVGTTRESIDEYIKLKNLKL
ncbi:MAG: DNA polymerase subunit beta [Methanobrevibacter sp.]|jgi:predicted nucleotidyltransferase|nr:DNA polymerase subunit beta [Methanobrevibacter sp.]